MANIQERRDKSGKLISYKIRVHRGRGPDGKQLKPWMTTFKVSPTWTEKSARKKAEAFAATFEKECRDGVTSDTRKKFSEYCDYVINLKEQRGKIKHSTAVRYRGLASRLYPAIGHLKLKDIRVDHLNSLYTELGKEGGGAVSAFATAKIDLLGLLKEKKLTRVKLSELAGVPLNNVYEAVKGKRLNAKAAEKIAGALGKKTGQIFTVEKKANTLTSKTVVEYHRLISTVLSQARKDGLVPFNVAANAMPPALQKNKPDYFQREEITAILEALESEPIKWRAITHLFLITGARRGEIAGLKWEAVDFENCRLHFYNNLLYASDVGIYEDTLKTDSSERFIVLPPETLDILREYRIWQNNERLRLGEYYQDKGFIFTRDNGDPIRPDSITQWMAKFSRRHDLPHIHPHAFRHTMASLLFFGKSDSVSISKRLGHAKVSTTTDIYSHIIQEADERNAEILGDVFLKKA